MFTRCPHCHTVYRLHADQLTVAGGEVCCSACGNRFNALENLFDSLDEAFKPVEAETAETPEIPEPESEVDEAAGQGGDTSGTAPEQAAGDASMPSPVQTEEGAETAAAETGAGEAQTEDADEAVSAEEAATPDSRDTVEIPAALLEDFEPPPPARTGLRLLQGSLLVGLLLLLLGQWVYVQRNTLYRLPEWQPWLESMCGLLGCELPLRHAPDRYVIRHKDVRAHPQVDNALLINVTLVNQAAFTQAYPLVGMFFSDLTGQTKAGRWFRPQTYLHPPEAVARGVKPGGRVDIRLEVVDPGVNLISYQFDFR